MKRNFMLMHDLLCANLRAGLKHKSEDYKDDYRKHRQDTLSTFDKIQGRKDYNMQDEVTLEYRNETLFNSGY